MEADDEEVIGERNTYLPACAAPHARPVLVANHTHSLSPIFTHAPLLGPLLFDNTDSDARDHCANERTFLSYLRLSMYMSIVSIAIIISFHLKSSPSPLELRMALPLGIVFWIIALLCLGVGLGNYVKTVQKYSRRQALVQTGWKTQVLITIITMSIVGTCVLFLSTNSQR